MGFPQLFPINNGEFKAANTIVLFYPSHLNILGYVVYWESKIDQQYNVKDKAVILNNLYSLLFKSR